ncbi:MAG: TIR domain-containing protein [Chitinophagaceae bacterium]|nr:MAG: TIR domain-containing protein [Chitinophagaceae bacterium]
MPIAFLSHASQNKALAEELYNRLGPNNSILDKYTFESGEKTLNQIFENLDRTDLFVLLISNSSLNSKWVDLEIRESKSKLDRNQIKRFLPINIDKNISYKDERIPKWISENYDLKPIANLNIIVNKIKRQIREITIENNPKLLERTKHFVGRNFLIEEFEDRFINIENIKPTLIVISGLEGIGRRTFLKKALEKNNQFKSTYEPAIINLEQLDTIDEYIIKLDEGYNSYKKEFITELINLNIQEKLVHIRKSVLEYLNNHEFIFFVENGSLISRDGHIRDWFIELCNSPEFENRITFCLITKYRPSKDQMFKLKYRVINQHITPLSDADKEKLFIRLMNDKEITFDETKKSTVVSFLNGFPEQIIFTADLIAQEGIDNVIKMKNYITDFYDNKLVNQFINVIEEPYTRDVIVLLARFGTISRAYLKEIFLDHEKLEQTLDNLYTHGAFELVGMSKEFLKVNNALADYLSRNLVEVSSDITTKLTDKISSIINDTSDIPSYSDTLNTLKQGLISGHNIPKNLLLPSLVLKSISVLYDRQDYRQVISLANSVLENSSNIESRVVRDLHYYLCLAYARVKDPRFEDEIVYFDYPEKDFLFGLYHRIKKNYSKAREHLTRAVKDMPNKIQARSELVLTLLGMEDYTSAESLAKENYTKHKNNPFYIQSYFKCLINKSLKGVNEKALMHELMEKIRANPHPKAPDMVLVMEGEYAYYVKHDVANAIDILKRSIARNNSKTNAMMSLLKIYKRQENFAAADDLKSKIEGIKEINADE